MRYISIIILVASLSCTFSAFAKIPQTSIGRYAGVDNTAVRAQKDLLSQTIQVRFPQNVQTIGDAVHYVLRYSGYSLVDQSKQNNALKITLSKSLPVIDRDFGPMPLKEALMMLISPAFSLENDPLNREINFYLKPEYTKYHRSTKQDKSHVAAS